MNKYLLIESSDPFESSCVAENFQMAGDLAQAGNEVTLFLVQNGVLASRQKAQGRGLDKAAAAGVQILADDFSLRERGIGAGEMLSAVSAAKLDVVLDQLIEGRKAIWL